MKLSALAVRRPVTTGMFFLAIVVLGLVSLSRLAVDQLPNVTRPSITVSTTYEGAAPEIVERLITERLEKTLATINNVKAIRSFSGEGSSSVTLDFSWGTNLDLAALDVHEKVSNTVRSLPEEADPPRVSKYDPASQPIMYLNLITNGVVSLADLWHYADNTLRYQLQQIAGVAAVDVWGGDQREIQVLVDRGRLAATGIALERVVEAIQAENSTKVGGHVARGHTDYVVRPLGEFRTLQDLAQVVLRADGTLPVYLKDVAEIRDGNKERLSITRVNRVPGLVLAVRKQSGTNTVQVADAIQAKFPVLRQYLPQTMRLHLMFDRAVFIRRSIAQVEQSAVFGGLIAIIVLVAFLRSWRPTIIIALSIPIAVVATFILLYQANISLNWMSLGGLALGIGMLVDNAVVVLENIFRHRQQGTERRRAAIIGTQEVSLAIVASTLTTLCVFFPLIFMYGMMGIVFQELALTVTFSLVASLVVALTLVPMLSAKWLGQHDTETANNASWRRLHAIWGRALEALETGYHRSLEGALRHRLMVLGVCGLLLSLSLTLYNQLGEELLPSVDEGMMHIRLELPIGTQLEVTDRILADMEQTVFHSLPDVQAMFARSGSGGAHKGFMWTRLPERSQRRQSLNDVIGELRQKLANYPDASVQVVERPSDVARLLGASRTERLEVDVYGYDLQSSRQLAQEIADRVKTLAGVSHVNLSMDARRPELQMTIDRRKASALGVSVRSILQTVETSMAGTVASQFRDGRSEYDILVRLQETDRRATADLERLMVTASGGRQVPLRSLSDTAPGRGPVGIERRGQERVISVQAGMNESRDFDSIAVDIERILATIDVPEGLQVVMGGERQEQRESHRNVLLTIALAVLLVYMIMAALFESLVHPFVILCTIPFAVVGGIVTLWATGTNVSMPVYIGAIMLVGIAVNNGIVMVDYTNQLLQRGRTVRAATLEGAVTRLRPVLITTLTTVMALIPMALGLGEGAEVWAPLGRVVVGGLFVSTVFTLFFVPTVYSLIEERRDRVRRELLPVTLATEAEPMVAD